MQFWPASIKTIASAIGCWLVIFALIVPAHGEGLRGGLHEGFGRLVLDLPKAMKFDAVIDGNALNITLAEPLPDLMRVKTPEGIADYLGAAQLSPDRKLLSFALKKPVALKSFTNNQSVVFDLSPIKEVAAKPVVAVAPTAVAKAPAASTIAPTATASIFPTSPPAQAPPASAPVVHIASQSSVPTKSPPVVAVAAPTTTLPAVANAAPPQTPTATVAQPEIPTNSPRPSPPSLVTVAMKSEHDRLSAEIAWADAPAAAMFQRGANYYVLFPETTRFDVASITKATGRAAEVLNVPGGSGFRFLAPKNMVAHATRTDKSWAIDFHASKGRIAEYTMRATGGTTASSGTSTTPATALEIDADGPAGPIMVGDPELGSDLRIIPTVSSGRGIIAEHSFGQFKLLPSTNGVVVLRTADDIDVTVSPNKIILSGRTGLALSRAIGSTRAVRQLFDFSQWPPDSTDFNNVRQLLQEIVAESDDSQKPQAWFDLAQFYLATDHAADAIGVIDILIAGDSHLVDDQSLKALRGAALVMMDDGARALVDLNDKRLDQFPDAQLWRAAATALSGDRVAAAKLFAAAPTIPVSYSPGMRARLNLLAADAALAAGDFTRVKDALAQFPRPDEGQVPVGLIGRAIFYQAELDLTKGNTESAKALLENLLDQGDAWGRAHAQYALVEIGRAIEPADKKMSAKEAIDRLERARFTWSNSELEYEILQKLGDLYFENGQPREGLQSLRDAVNYYPDGQANAKIRQHMSESFVKLYDASNADIAPLAALAVYDDFRDLTPPGPKGDEMIQHLSDRLIAIDLLDRADGLLDYQIRTRLNGVDKARVGLRLGIVRLLDHNPKGAIAALEASQADNLPADLVTERRHLAARAIAATGGTTEALARLEGDTSKDADQIRAEIYSAAKDWPKTAEVLTKLVGPTDQGEMTPERQRIVLNLAVADVLAGDDAAVIKLHDQFAPKFAPGADQDAFNMLTSGGGGGKGLDTAALSVKFGELSAFQSAMNDYREKIKASENIVN